MLIELSNSGRQDRRGRGPGRRPVRPEHVDLAGQGRVADRREVVVGDRAGLRVEPGQAPAGHERRHRLVGGRVGAVGHGEGQRGGDPGLGQQRLGLRPASPRVPAPTGSAPCAAGSDLGMSEQRGVGRRAAADGGDVGVAVGRRGEGQAHLLVGEHLAAHVGHEVVDHAGARVDRALLEALHGGDVLLDRRRGRAERHRDAAGVAVGHDLLGDGLGVQALLVAAPGRGAPGAPGRCRGSSSGCAPRCRPCPAPSCPGACRARRRRRRRCPRHRGRPTSSPGRTRAG